MQVSPRGYERAGRQPVVADAASLRAAALGLLARRDFSERELRDRLAARFGLDHQDPLLHPLVGDLQSLGYQSDERFAAMFVRSWRQRGCGPQRIEQELRQRGIAGELVEALVDRQDPGWCELAHDIVMRKFGDHCSPVDSCSRVEEPARGKSPATGVARARASFSTSPLLRSAAMKQKARMVRFLQYRGFTQAQIDYALRR